KWTPPVLSPSSPLKSARVFLDKFHTHRGVRTLVRWRDEWRVWTGDHYEALHDDDMRAELYRFLDTAVVRTKVEGAWVDKPFNPDDTKVNKVHNALRAEVHYRNDYGAPSFR